MTEPTGRRAYLPNEGGTETITRLIEAASHDYQPSPRVKQAIKKLRKERRLSWEELNRAPTI